MCPQSTQFHQVGNCVETATDSAPMKSTSPFRGRARSGKPQKADQRDRRDGTAPSQGTARVREKPWLTTRRGPGRPRNAQGATQDDEGRETKGGGAAGPERPRRRSEGPPDPEDRDESPPSQGMTRSAEEARRDVPKPRLEIGLSPRRGPLADTLAVEAGNHIGTRTGRQRIHARRLPGRADSPCPNHRQR